MREILMNNGTMYKKAKLIGKSLRIIDWDSVSKNIFVSKCYIMGKTIYVEMINNIVKRHELFSFEIEEVLSNVTKEFGSITVSYANYKYFSLMTLSTNDLLAIGIKGSFERYVVACFENGDTTIVDKKEFDAFKRVRTNKFGWALLLEKEEHGLLVTNKSKIYILNKVDGDKNMDVVHLYKDNSHFWHGAIARKTLNRDVKCSIKEVDSYKGIYHTEVL